MFEKSKADGILEDRQNALGTAGIMP